MGVGADHQRHPPVEMIGERLLLARRLGMKIDDDGVRLFAERTGGDLAVDHGEGIVHGVHEHAAHGVDDQHAGAAARHVEAAAAAGRPRRIVERPQETVLPLGEDQRLALVEDVVAGSPRRRRRPAPRRMSSVMPKPPAAFSPFTTTKSSFQSLTRPGRRSLTMARPERPTMSPMTWPAGSDRGRAPAPGRPAPLHGGRPRAAARPRHRARRAKTFHRHIDCALLAASPAGHCHAPLPKNPCGGKCLGGEAYVPRDPFRQRWRGSSPMFSRPCAWLPGQGCVTLTPRASHAIHPTQKAFSINAKASLAAAVIDQPFPLPPLPTPTWPMPFAHSRWTRSSRRSRSTPACRWAPPMSPRCCSRGS